MLIKKITSAILAVAMVAAMSTTVFAGEGEKIAVAEDNGVFEQLDVENDTLNPSNFEEANNQLVEIGKNASKGRNAGVVNIGKYFQGGESWSNDLMKSMNLPIGTHGCTVTSFAMILEYYGYYNNPRQVNTTLGNSACEFDYVPAGNKYNLTIQNYKRDNISNSYATDFITGSIASSMPVLVGMRNSSGGTHFVAAYGYAENMSNPNLDNEIYINDPTRSRNYSTLSQYLNAGWTVHRLYSYS